MLCWSLHYTNGHWSKTPGELNHHNISSKACGKYMFLIKSYTWEYFPCTTRKLTLHFVCISAEDLASKTTPQGLKRAVEGKTQFWKINFIFRYFWLLIWLSSVSPEDIGEMILQLRKQVESLFSSKYSESWAYSTFILPSTAAATSKFSSYIYPTNQISPN